jgi:hypothetical protein
MRPIQQARINQIQFHDKVSVKVHEVILANFDERSLRRPPESIRFVKDSMTNPYQRENIFRTIRVIFSYPLFMTSGLPVLIASLRWIRENQRHDLFYRGSFPQGQTNPVRNYSLPTRSRSQVQPNPPILYRVPSTGSRQAAHPIYPTSCQTAVPLCTTVEVSGQLHLSYPLSVFEPFMRCLHNSPPTRATRPHADKLSKPNDQARMALKV